MSSQAPSMKADQERVSQLLTDTVTLLCRNGLQYKTDMKVQGLLGITLDGGEEMFLVHIDKKFGEMIGAELVSLHANEETSTTGAPGAGSTASALDDDEDHEDGTDSDASATSVSTSSISRKRHRGPRRKRRASTSSSLTTNSLVGSPSAEKKLATDNTVVVKPDPDAVLEEDDDLVMLDTPDSKHGLHDKDSMRESYGVTYLGGEPPRDPDIAEEESYVAELARQLRPTNHHQNSTATTSKQDQTAGCSTWDDPLAALTGVHNNATHLNSTGGEDPLLDPQAMSTIEYDTGQSTSQLHPRFQPANRSSVNQRQAQFKSPAAVLPADWRRGSNTFNTRGKRRNNLTGPASFRGTRHGFQGQPTDAYHSYVPARRWVDDSEKKFVCGYEGCTKAYLSRTNLLHHQAYKHGRPKGAKGPVIIRKSPSEEGH